MSVHSKPLKSRSSRLEGMLRPARIVRRSFAALALSTVMAGGIGLAHEGVLPAEPGPPQPAIGAPAADFAGELASDDARKVADWALETHDNQGAPFVIVDKKTTKVFVFSGHGKLLGATGALIGLARGDDSAPGVGDRKLSQIQPWERTTPAGRFVASLGYGLGKQDILWVDYPSALALHRVLSVDAKERRLERLAAPSPNDRRITFGCINVSARFYDTYISPTFARSSGIVYILPEVKSLDQVFFAARL